MKSVCLLCGSIARTLFSTKDGFNLMWCANCEFGRLHGHFTPEQVAGFYAADYYTHRSGGRSSGSTSFSEKALIRLAWSMDRGLDFDPAELPNGRTVCDIGCGNGDVLRKFKAAGYRTVGIEPDASARKAASDAGQIVPGTAEAIPDVGTFDVVLMSHVLEHCIDPAKAVENAASLLASGGTLVIEVPNNAALGFKWFGDQWPWTDTPRHLSFFTDTSLSLLLARHGLKVVKTFYTGFTRQFVPQWRRSVQSSLSGLPLLTASAFADRRSKYDSIRVHAKLD